MSGERQISCSDVGEEGNKQNNIKLNGETPTSCYQTTNWAEWEDQHAQGQSDSTHRQRRLPDKIWTLNRIKERFHGREMRAGQWEALKLLIFRLIDVIVVAKTGFGKSLL